MRQSASTQGVRDNHIYSTKKPVKQPQLPLNTVAVVAVVAVAVAVAVAVGVAVGVAVAMQWLWPGTGKKLV